MSVRQCCGGSARVKVSAGLATATLGIVAWAAVHNSGFDGAGIGRRLFVESSDVGYDYVTQVGTQVQEDLPTCKTLMRLFKTVAASPQAALARMSSTGKPTLQEWTDSIQDWKWGLSRSQISSIFRGIDTEMDGQVDIHELLSCFRRGEYEGQFWQPANAPAASFQPDASTVQGLNSQYNCHDGLEMWRFEWSKEKQVSCSLISASELRGSLAPNLTPAEVLRQMDTNGDAVVSHDEWVAAATGLAGQGPFVKTLIEPRAEFAFKSMDVSQDGLLNQKDLESSLGLGSTPLGAGPRTSSGVSAAALKDRVLARWSTLSNAFQKIDQDDNHRLSRAEFLTGLAELRPPIEDAAEVAHLFEGFDALHDDRITPPEWHGTLQTGQLFQTPEALQQVLHMGSEHSSSWIHRSPKHAASSQGAGAEKTPDQAAVPEKEGITDSRLKELGGHLDSLAANAESTFREKAVKWAGSMRNACMRMGVLRDAISPSAFQAAIGGFEPLLADETSTAIFNQMDADKDGFISSAECFMSQEELAKQLSSASSLRNLFCDADFNNDGQLSREEFAKFGKLLNQGSAEGKFSAYFDELAGAGKPPITLAALEKLAGKSTAGKQALSKEDGAKYGLPAIIHGKCVLGVKGSNIPPGLSDKVGESFSSTLSQRLGVTVRVAGAQEQQGTTSKEFDVLYTSKTQDGAAVMSKLQENADSIQTELENGVAALVSPSASASAWCRSTMDFYGPKAGDLPKGQKVTQEFGQLAGKPKETGSPFVETR